MYPFERFSDDAKLTLQMAQEEAQLSQHSYVGTEHLLLGLLRLEQGTGREVLTGLGISFAEVRNKISMAVGSGERGLIQNVIPTSRVKRVIEIAFEQARRMGHDHVDTGHILLALVLEGHGLAAQVLTDLGASRANVIDALDRKLGLPVRSSIVEGLDRQQFREVMAAFPSGVVVLTAFGEDDRPRGLTVSAFCAVSLEPPLALVCIDMTSNTLPALSHSGGFTANILAAGREQLARRMATKLTDKFDGIEWRRPESKLGGPILEADTAAYAVCTLRDTIEAGDHWVLIGLVTEGQRRAGVEPMVFSGRTFT
jgi:flavin reductase (DIM6/NTAB) family NADH-FMN oxidoreductase RutF